MAPVQPSSGASDKNLRNHVLHLWTPLFAFFDRPAHPIRADCIYLQEKHPEMFNSPEAVRGSLGWAFARPDFAYPAHGPIGYFSIVRRGECNTHAVVDLRDANGQYRVRHLTLIQDDQLAQHLGNTPRAWKRGP